MKLNGFEDKLYKTSSIKSSIFLVVANCFIVDLYFSQFKRLEFCFTKKMKKV